MAITTGDAPKWNDAAVLDVTPDLGEGVLGFEARGKVVGADYEDVMVPAVEAALETADKISLLYVLGAEFEGYSADAAWEDTKLGIHHASDFDRIGLVTDHKAYSDAVSFFGRAMKADVKVFPNAELELAKSWIAG